MTPGVEITRYVVMHLGTSIPAALLIVVSKGPTITMYYETADGSRRGRTNMIRYSSDMGIHDEAEFHQLYDDLMFNESWELVTT